MDLTGNFCCNLPGSKEAPIYFRENQIIVKFLV